MNPELRDDGRTALILYGSETGNAQDVACELGRMTERLHFLSRVSDLDSVKVVSRPCQPVLLFQRHGAH